MAWDIALQIASASDGTPLSDISIREATPEAPLLAITDASGAAAVTLDADSNANLSLYMATTKFSIETVGDQNQVTIYDPQVYTRVSTGLSPFAEDQPKGTVTYTITDSADGSPIANIRLIDPLTGTVLASNPEATLDSLKDEVFAAFSNTEDAGFFVQSVVPPLPT